MKTFFALLVLYSASLAAQQPQSQTAPISALNAKYANGVAPGYWPTAGSGLTLNVSGGTAFCSGSVVTYSAGTLTMTASTTNNIYLNTASSCVPAVKTSAFTTSDIPVAQVVTSGSAITSIADVRTLFHFGGVSGTSPIVVAGNVVSCPTCSTGSVSPLYLNWTFNSGVVATDAAPRFLASHAASIATCYALTTSSDGSTALTFNIFDNGSTIFSGGAQTIAAGTAAGTLTTLGSLGTTSIANNDKLSINITSGTTSWIFTVQCK